MCFLFFSFCFAFSLFLAFSLFPDRLQAPAEPQSALLLQVHGMGEASHGLLCFCKLVNPWADNS
jgi:hypothetical protein